MTKSWKIELPGYFYTFSSLMKASRFIANYQRAEVLAGIAPTTFIRGNYIIRPVR